MDDTKKKQIRAVVEHFRNAKVPVTNELLEEFCNKNKFDLITAGDYSDYLYQTQIDEKMVEIFPKMLQICVDHIQYVPEFGTEKEHAAQDEQRLNAQEAMVKLLEETEMDYHFANHCMKEFAQIIGTNIERAGTVAQNKAMQVILHVCRDKFGGHIHMGHVKNYAEEVFTKAKKDK